jgi:hypothetical protein
MKFASPPLVSSRDSMLSHFHAERREMHLVECMPQEQRRGQATSVRCSKIDGVSPVKADALSQQDVITASEKACTEGNRRRHLGRRYTSRRYFSSKADHCHSPMVTVQVTVESWRSTAWRISLTWTALLLLLLLLGHRSIPHGHVVIVAAVRGIGIFASGNLRLLALDGSVVWVSWGLTLLLCWISVVISILLSAISALASISLLLLAVSDDQLVKKKGVKTYYCVDFLHDRSFGKVNGLSCTNKTYLSLDITTGCRRDIDLATC